MINCIAAVFFHSFQEIKIVWLLDQMTWSTRKMDFFEAHPYIVQRCLCTVAHILWPSHCAIHLNTVHQTHFLLYCRIVPDTSVLYSLHCGGPLNCGPIVYPVSDLPCLWFMCSLSAENKRRSKHAGKSLNPEWNQTVIYKNIHLEQVCGWISDSLKTRTSVFQ